MIIGRGEFFSSLKCPEGFFGLHTLILSGYRGPHHRVSSVRRVKLITIFQTVPIFRMNGVIRLHPSDAFNAVHRDQFTFTAYCT